MHWISIGFFKFYFSVAQSYHFLAMLVSIDRDVKATLPCPLSISQSCLPHQQNTYLVPRKKGGKKKKRRGSPMIF